MRYKLYVFSCTCLHLFEVHIDVIHTKLGQSVGLDILHVQIHHAYALGHVGRHHGILYRGTGYANGILLFVVIQHHQDQSGGSVFACLDLVLRIIISVAACCG